MDINSLLHNEALRHHEFPITHNKIFLAHAAVSPLPRRVCNAIQDYVQRASSVGQFSFLYAEAEKETRQHLATLLNAHYDEIAIVPSTSSGLSVVACGLTWQQGDNIIVADGDFPSNIYPWLNLERRRVQVRFLPKNKEGSITIDDITRCIDRNTRLVSLSTVNFISGFKLDVNTIGKYLNERGVLFCLDAVQSLGVIPLDVENVDFLAASAHKWLLGPQGIGLLYVKRKHFNALNPSAVGWKCVINNEDYLDYNLAFVDSACRYEPGTPNILGLMGFHAALCLLLEVGIDHIEERLKQMRQLLVPALIDKGYEVIKGNDVDGISGITSFTSATKDIPRLRRELDAAGYIVSLREALHGGKCIRIAPHFYNTDNEIKAFISMLPDGK